MLPRRSRIAFFASSRLRGLDKAVFSFGLARRLDPGENRAFIDQVVAIRSRLRQKIIAAGAASVVESFDPARYTENATIGENIIFGVPKEVELAGTGLCEQPLIKDLLQDHLLFERLARMGERIASTMLEIFKDIRQDNILFEQFAFVPADSFPDYVDILNRRAGGASNTADDLRLIGLAFLYIEPRHRLGLLDDTLKRKLLLVRAAFRAHADADIAQTVDFYDPDAYCPSASLGENLLFGLIVHGAAAGADRALAAMTEIIEDEGLLWQVYRLGLEQPAGYGGRLLYPSTKLSVVLARNLVKRPSILVLNEAFGVLSETEGKRLLQRVRQDMIGCTVIVIGRKIDADPQFDLTVAFDGTRMTSIQQDQLGQAQTDPQASGRDQAEPSENPELTALRSVSLFAGLDLANLKLLAFTSERVVFRPGETLFAAGDAADVAYTIVGGMASVLVETSSGPVEISRVGANEIVGEMGIITGEPRSATIVATGEVVALRIKKDIFLSLLSEFPAMALSVTRLMVKRLQDNVSAVGRRRHQEGEA